MQNFEDLGRELSRRGKTEQLKALAGTDDVQRLSRMLDTAAAKSGDSDALKAILSQVLSTAEGQRLAQSVQQMMQD